MVDNFIKEFPVCELDADGNAAAGTYMCIQPTRPFRGITGVVGMLQGALAAYRAYEKMQDSIAKQRLITDRVKAIMEARVNRWLSKNLPYLQDVYAEALAAGCPTPDCNAIRAEWVTCATKVAQAMVVQEDTWLEQWHLQDGWTNLQQTEIRDTAARIVTSGFVRAYRARQQEYFACVAAKDNAMHIAFGIADATGAQSQGTTLLASAASGAQNITAIHYGQFSQGLQAFGAGAGFFFGNGSSSTANGNGGVLGGYGYG